MLSGGRDDDLSDEQEEDGDPSSLPHPPPPLTKRVGGITPLPLPRPLSSRCRKDVREVVKVGDLKELLWEVVRTKCVVDGCETVWRWRRCGIMS